MKNSQLIREAINQQVTEIKQHAHAYQDSICTTAKEYDELARLLKAKTDRIKDLAYELVQAEKTEVVVRS